MNQSSTSFQEQNQPNFSRPQKKRKYEKWTEGELLRLEESVVLYGEGNLSSISNYIGTKSNAQVKTRLRSFRRQKELEKRNKENQT